MHGVGSLLSHLVKEYPAFCRTCGFITTFKKPAYLSPPLSTNSFLSHSFYFVPLINISLHIFVSMFLCDFSYHACYLLCPPYPTRFDNAKIWCLSWKSSPPAWRVSKWLKPWHCIQVVCMASWSTFGSCTHPSMFLCPTAVTLHLPLLMAVHSCVQCYCFKHYCYYSRLYGFHLFIYIILPLFPPLWIAYSSVPHFESGGSTSCGTVQRTGYSLYTGRSWFILGLHSWKS